MSKANTFTQREIAVALNNALVAARAPNRIGEIDEKRLARLHEYARLLFSPLEDELVAFAELKNQDDPKLRLSEEEALKPEEAVFICIAGALFFHMHKVMRATKVNLPTAGDVKTLLGEAE